MKHTSLFGLLVCLLDHREDRELIFTGARAGSQAHLPKIRRALVGESAPSTRHRQVRNHAERKPPHDERRGLQRVLDRGWSRRGIRDPGLSRRGWWRQEEAGEEDGFRPEEPHQRLFRGRVKQEKDVGQRKHAVGRGLQGAWRCDYTADQRETPKTKSASLQYRDSPLDIDRVANRSTALHHARAKFTYFVTACLVLHSRRQHLLAAVVAAFSEQPLLLQSIFEPRQASWHALISTHCRSVPSREGMKSFRRGGRESYSSYLPVRLPRGLHHVADSKADLSWGWARVEDRRVYPPESESAARRKPWSLERVGKGKSLSRQKKGLEDLPQKDGRSKQRADERLRSAGRPAKGCA